LKDFKKKPTKLKLTPGNRLGFALTVLPSSTPSLQNPDPDMVKKLFVKNLNALLDKVFPLRKDSMFRGLFT
jgi:hypothetical protein